MRLRDSFCAFVLTHRTRIGKYLHWAHIVASLVLLGHLGYALFSGIGERPAHYWGYDDAIAGSLTFVSLWLLGFYSRRPVA